MRKRKFFGGLAVAAVAALTLAGCAGGGTPATTDGATTGTEAGGETFKVGISQFVQHGALDAATAGFQQALADAGLNVEYDLQNANAEQGTTVTIAQAFAADSSIDLVLAVATPSAQAAATAITDRPVLFTAVTDPVSAALVDSNEAPGGNVTGTTDMNPVADQIALIKEVNPEAATVGVIYASGEVNSQIQVDIAQAAATENGMTLKTATVSTTNDIPTALESLGDIDAIYVPTDNLVVAGIDSVMQYSDTNKVPVFSGDTAPVEEAGAIATYGLDYEKLGYQTGEMAVKILKGEAEPATMAVEAQTDFDLVINKTAAAAIGLEIPQALLDRAAKVIE
ncbi:ABC transporter substrate-binding protein [Gulosibacter macacae]|uniref:ABC transporter substrate-binding protein n=1 Tax=Gulosibacter macacae TaxID=2488791 RepID=A0A3P3W2M5_9MICO|nr:ABC transporter substrate-binding protein [Gulosibacter macacae]RRJ88628.1 ABC transporter substrate-binding protein [Gulosibacter macacae]